MRPFGVVIPADLVFRARLAESDMKTNAVKSMGQFADLAGQGVMPAVSRAVDENDRTLFVLDGERVEHAHHRRHPNATAYEDNRTLLAGHHEVASGPARVDERSRLDMIMQVT